MAKPEARQSESKQWNLIFFSKLKLCHYYSLQIPVAIENDRYSRMIIFKMIFKILVNIL